MKAICRVLFTVLVVSVLAAGCSTGYGSRTNISTGAGVAIGAGAALGLGALGYFLNDSSKVRAGTETERIQAYKALNARCALGGNGSVTVARDGVDHQPIFTEKISVDGTSATPCPPVGIVPYPEHGNTGYTQPQLVGARPTYQPASYQRRSCGGLPFNAYLECVKQEGW